MILNDQRIVFSCYHAQNIIKLWYFLLVYYQIVLISSICAVLSSSNSPGIKKKKKRKKNGSVTIVSHDGWKVLEGALPAVSPLIKTGSFVENVSER